MKAAICYLTQNNDIRKTYLKTSLYFLFKFFNEKFRYPVIIFHEGDYDNEGQQDIINSIRASCRNLVTFQALHPNDFKLPDHIDEKKLDRILDITPSPVPYWRNKNYRMMCRWWLLEFMKYVKHFDYVMRLDDDSFIEEHINKDLFKWMGDNDLNYASNLLHTDCGICCYGMKQFFEKEYPNKQKEIKSLFIPQEIPLNSVMIHPFRSILSITQDPLPNLTDKETLWMPIMYYNNFFITKTAFWNTPEMLEILDKIDKNGSIFYWRWGDAPIQSILAILHSNPNQVQSAKFAYSKRLQRESFKGNDNHYHSYMPATYDKTSCITEQKELMDKLANLSN